MKKLKLNFQNIEGALVLTREQLKTVMGGSGGSGTKKKCTSSCWNKPIPPSEEKIFTGSVTVDDCDTVQNSGKCSETYSNTAGATCVCTTTGSGS